MESDRGVKEMTIEAMKQALEALENVRSYDKGDLYGLDEDIAAIRVAIEQAERDWSLLEATQESLREHMAEIQRLKQRQWVGLTDEEKRQIVLDDPIDWVAAIEAKLKEKNETS
jgi:GAF domain-containing protein